MQVSDHYDGKIFLNPVPTDVMAPSSMFGVMRQYFKNQVGREPSKPVGPFVVNEKLLAQLPPQTLRITWLGHSSLLLEIDGRRLLIDPVWSNRASPFSFAGPKRFFQNPLALDALPPIDYILLSHDHYDHLDKKAIIKLTKSGIRVVTMLGVGKRLIDWGIKKEMVAELDWWDSLLMDIDFKVTATPTRHFSGRGLHDRFKTLWGAFVIEGPRHKVFFGADSGYYKGFTAIKEKFGSFDLALLEVGAYNNAWADIHMGPENAIQAALDLGSPLMMPIHWGTFNLAMHAWKEPVERVIEEAARKKISLFLPAPGETVVVNHQSYNSEWWTKAEWTPLFKK